jgi:hypothetical protein
MAHTPVLVAYDALEPWLIFTDDFEAIVGTAILADDIFEVGVPLKQDSPNRLFYVGSLII